MNSCELNSPPLFFLSMKIFSLVAFSTKHWNCLNSSKYYDLFFRKYTKIILIQSSMKTMKYFHPWKEGSIGPQMSLLINYKHMLSRHVFVKKGTLYCLPMIQDSHLLDSFLKVGNPFTISFVVSSLRIWKFKWPNL